MGLKLRYTKAGQVSVLEVPAADPFELCNFARARIFGGELPERDEVFEGIMRARREASEAA